MKLRKTLIVTMLTGLVFSFAFSPGYVQGADPVIRVLNPLGTPPPIKLKAMAPRLDTIDGKTIYVDNNGYPGTSVLLPELIAVMKERFPNTKFIYNDKPAGSMNRTEDPALGKADALIVATGH